MDERIAGEAQLEAGGPATGSGLLSHLRRNLTPRLGATLAIWRVEAYTATPIALALVATLGRWPGALVMGSLMAVYAAVFLFLLDGQPLLHDVDAWARQRRLGRLLDEVAGQRGWKGALRRALAVPAAVMFLGPFWRAVAFHIVRVPRIPAYTLSVGGSIPHAFLWTGVVVGGLWEAAIRPFLKGL